MCRKEQKYFCQGWGHGMLDVSSDHLNGPALWASHELWDASRVAGEDGSFFFLYPAIPHQWMEK